MKFLAIDYGLKRTGLAVSDAGGAMAFPRGTLAMRGKEAFLASILTFVADENIEGIVVGLPSYGNGDESETTRMVRNVAARLGRHCPVPVYLMPEELSSSEAESRLRQGGQKSAQVKRRLDQAAAVLILESFLALPAERRVQVASGTA